MNNLSSIWEGKHVIIDGVNMNDRDTKVLLALLLHSLPVSGSIPDVVYFPTERAGLLKTYKILAAAILEYALHANSNQKKLPFSALTVDFLKILVRMEKTRGRYADIAYSLEQEAMQGSVEIKSRDGVTEIRYNYKGQSMPLSVASSSILELAPITLCLKHVIEPGSLLIIEEPESNLDLEKQRILAKFLVRLVRNDLNVMITNTQSIHTGAAEPTFYRQPKCPILKE